jgi:hypothetical protein
VGSEQVEGIEQAGGNALAERKGKSRDKQTGIGKISGM